MDSTYIGTWALWVKIAVCNTSHQRVIPSGTFTAGSLRLLSLRTNHRQTPSIESYADEHCDDCCCRVVARAGSVAAPHLES